MSGDGRLLDATRVQLGLRAGSRGEAVETAVALLRDEPRIASWDAFRAAVGPKQVVDLESGGVVILAHGRSPAVRELVLSAARWESPEGRRVVFVFAIPAAMAEEYLRKVGALARLCREQGKLDTLLAAATPEQFASVVEDWLA